MVSLTQSQRMAVSGMKTTQEAVEITMANIVNSNVKGYSRKVVAEKTQVQQGISDSVGAGVMMGDVRRQVDERLLRDHRDAGSQHAYYKMAHDLQTRLQTTFGRVGEGTDFSTKVSALAAALSKAAQNTASTVNRQVILNAAQDVVLTVQRVTTDLQNQRSDADQMIVDVVTRVNQLSKEIHENNVKIYTWQASRFDITDLEDQRDRAIAELSQLINISVSTQANGAKWVTTSQGLSLVDSHPFAVSYTPLGGAMGPSILQANGDFNPIELLGQDLTKTVTGGKLKALIDQRDATVPDLQRQVAAFATALRDQVNEVHNQGSAYPGATQLASTTPLGTTAAETLAVEPQWSGVMRVAVVDARGRFNRWADVDLSAVTTVGDWVNAVNTALGSEVASVNANGVLSVVAPSGYGVALGQGCNGDASVMVQGQPIAVSHYFGFNNFFVTPGNTVLQSPTADNAVTLALRPDLINAPQRLALSRLSTTASPSSVPTAGAVSEALSSGDTTIVTALWSRLTAQDIAFGQAGSLGGVTTTFAQYGGVIVAHNAVQAKSVMDNETYYKRLRDQLEQNVLSVSGVNVDLEFQRNEEYRKSYTALAQVFQTTGRMMDELLSLPRR